MGQPEVMSDDHCATVSLPHGYQRSDVIRILNQIAPALGLNGGVLRTLMNMIHTTRPQDWVDGKTGPWCFREQTKIADAVGQTSRTIRNHEAALVARGLVAKTVGGDGSRGRFGKGAAALGISFEPLVRRFGEFAALASAMEERSMAREIARRSLSAGRRELNRLIALAAEREYCSQPVLDALSLRDSLPRRYDDIETEALEAHIKAVDKAVASLQKTPLGRQNFSGAPEKNDRPHIQATTDTQVSCNGLANLERSACEQDEDISEPSPSAEAVVCLENKCGADQAARNKKITESFSQKQLYAMATPAMQLYLDVRQSDPAKLCQHDFVQAAIAMLRELGIHPTAWDDAVETMGDFAAALCVLVVDANMTHPVKPIRSPGATLRAFARLASKGKLNLFGSLMGLKSRTIKH